MSSIGYIYQLSANYSVYTKLGIYILLVAHQLKSKSLTSVPVLVLAVFARRQSKL